MPETLPESETPKNPSLDVLKWIQTRIFTCSQAYFHESMNQKIIDQIYGGDGKFFWMGLENEGGDTFMLKDKDGSEKEVTEMAHVTIEAKVSHSYQLRLFKVLQEPEGPKVHTHRDVRDYKTNTKESEYRFLDDDETAKLYEELERANDYLS